MGAEPLDALALPEGRTILTVHGDGTVRRWTDDLPDDREGLLAWLRETVG